MSLWRELVLMKYWLTLGAPKEVRLWPGNCAALECIIDWLICPLIFESV